MIVCLKSLVIDCFFITIIIIIIIILHYYTGYLVYMIFMEFYGDSLENEEVLYGLGAMLINWLSVTFVVSPDRPRPLSCEIAMHVISKIASMRSIEFY